MYVADAHPLGWYFTDDARLGEKAARVFERSERLERLYRERVRIPDSLQRRRR